MEENNFAVITSKEIQEYCDRYSSQASEILNQLEGISSEAGNIKMISGPFLGQFISMISLMLHPKIILEIGTFTGYGTLCLARGLATDGKIYTIEKNTELEGYYKRVADPGKYPNIIQLMGDASEIIPAIDAIFDLVFIDAAKRQYIHYYELVLPKLRPGGIIIADNVLWKGKVVSKDNDKLGEGLHNFNQHVFEDSRVENIILPIDDGLHLIFKKW